jgi:hypothetical protein
MPVLLLQKKEGLAIAPVVNLVPISLVDATLGVDLIILSSNNEDEVDWETLATEDESTGKPLQPKTMMTSSPWVAIPR